MNMKGRNTHFPLDQREEGGKKYLIIQDEKSTASPYAHKMICPNIYCGCKSAPLLLIPPDPDWLLA